MVPIILLCRRNVKKDTGVAGFFLCNVFGGRAFGKYFGSSPFKWRRKIAFLQQ
jgi:hypothetical protein